MKELIRETPEAGSWVYAYLRAAEIRVPTVEGYSVKGIQVTALFERLKSTTNCQDWSVEEIKLWIKEHEDTRDWADRIFLASQLKVPMYLVIWNDDLEISCLFSLCFENGKVKICSEQVFSTSKELATWLSKLKGIQVSKVFMVPGRLSSIDKRLREHEVPWPGNLDGFIYDRKTCMTKAIFEFSRTRVYPVKTHDLNKYFNEDTNRWKVLDILKNQLGVPLYIVIWSSREEIIKVSRVDKITDHALIYGSTEILDKDQIIPYFSRCIIGKQTSH